MANRLLQAPVIGECHFSSLHQGTPGFSEVLAYYNTIRSYIQHEDGLINSRLTWSLTVHGFLLASFGLMFSKSTELFADFNRVPGPANPLLLGFQIAFLCLAQALVATLGAFVGVSSYGAIRSAHFAIQHLACIAHAGSLLDTTPSTSKLVAAVSAGDRAAQLDSIQNIARGMRVAVGAKNRQEVVTVCDVTGTVIQADFQNDHAAGTEVRTLGWALLPKVIAGGDAGSNTGRARTYYLALPIAAACLWVFLGCFSTLLGVVAAFPHVRNVVLDFGRSYSGTSQPATPGPSVKRLQARHSGDGAGPS